MININLYVLLIASLSFFAVEGRHNFFEDYISKYIHKSSSATPTVSSTTEFPTPDVIFSFSKDDNESIPSDITILHSGGRNYEASAILSSVGPIVGGLIFVALVICCIFHCCCNAQERKGFIIENRGIEALPQPEIMPTPQQHTVFQHIPPEYSHQPMQQFPLQYNPTTLPPMQYALVQPQRHQYSPVQQQPTYSPVQHQNQYSPVQPQPAYSPVQHQNHYSPAHPGYQDASTMQFYNPPEPPPPYAMKNIK